MNLILGVTTKLAMRTRLQCESSIKCNEICEQHGVLTSTPVREGLVGFEIQWWIEFMAYVAQKNVEKKIPSDVMWKASGAWKSCYRKVQDARLDLDAKPGTCFTWKHFACVWNNSTRSLSPLFNLRVFLHSVDFRFYSWETLVFFFSNPFKAFFCFCMRRIQTEIINEIAFVFAMLFTVDAISSMVAQELLKSFCLFSPRRLPPSLFIPRPSNGLAFEWRKSRGNI